jgi:hypothetical protein
MRIVTRPDFDGVVCAALIAAALATDPPVHWVEPSDLQAGKVDIRPGDIIANLPFHPRCDLWFDHHATNAITGPYKGLFRLTPSAARNVFSYFKDRLPESVSELVHWADRIDSADFTREQVLHPENHPYIVLSMTVSGEDPDGEPYWNRLVRLLRGTAIGQVMADTEVQSRCRRVVEANARYAQHLKACTRVERRVSVTDFRLLEPAPAGNRFLVYSLFPETVVNVRIRYEDQRKLTLVVNIGRSIFNGGCNVHIGSMLTAFEGGGHRGAGSTRFPAAKAGDYLPRILDILMRNEAKVPLP